MTNREILFNIVESFKNRLPVGYMTVELNARTNAIGFWAPSGYPPNVKYVPKSSWEPNVSKERTGSKRVGTISLEDECIGISTLTRHWEFNLAEPDMDKHIDEFVLRISGTWSIDQSDCTE
jgi:hypothetical protein